MNSKMFQLASRKLNIVKKDKHTTKLVENADGRKKKSRGQKGRERARKAVECPNT